MDPFSSSPGLLGQPSLMTKYSGVFFRSRLEARWAVYFDLCGMTWAYEPTIFDFPNGPSYLPDFWLRELEVWVEVKGQIPMSPDDQAKVDAFRATGRPITVLSDIPDEPGNCRTALRHRFD